MSFDKLNQLEAAINTYGLRMSTFGKDDPHTKINHLMCMELIRDLKTERDAPSKFPGMVVRIDYEGRHIAVSLSQVLIDSAPAPIAMVAESVRGAIAEVLRP